MYASHRYEIHTSPKGRMENTMDKSLETDQNYVTLIVLSDGTFMDVADAKMILVKAEQYEEVCNLGGSGHDFNPLASIDLSNLNIIPNFA